MNDNFNFNQFIEKYEEYLPLGDSRRTFYEHVCNHLINLGRPVLVVETGTMWSKQGASTLFFADFIKNWTGGRIITIDISEEHINLCKENTKEFSDVITYIVSDSIEYLSLIGPSLGKKIDYLYLDSFDLNFIDPIPSQIHHLRELLAVYKNLPNHVIIGVDDNLLPGNWIEWNRTDGSVEIITADKYIIGKGTLVDRFLRDNGWHVFNNNYSFTLLGYFRD